MFKTIEEQIKEIKHCGECAIYSIKNHKLPWLTDDGTFDNIIINMHNAQNKDKLSEAYYNYIINAIAHGYSDGDIIGAIMQNDEQNKKFNVNIESIIKSLIQIRNPNKSFIFTPNSVDNSSAPVKCNSTKKLDPEAGGIEVSNKRLNKIKNKINYANKLLNKLQNNESENFVTDMGVIRSICDEAGKMILDINPTSCTEQEISDLNDANAAISNLLKSLDKLPTKSDETTIVKSKDNVVQQSEAAHTEGGFNINNFIKQKQQNPVIPAVNNPTVQPTRQTAFPHQIDNLTDAEIVEDVRKHFKLLCELPAYPLYDLAHNKILARKMKELNAKQRPNNPFLTQVNINEYIDVPELLAQYNLCFTIPCNDKDKIIIVLFNTNAKQDANGIINYPIHIFKATRNKTNK